MRKVLVSHPTGISNVRVLLKGLSDSSSLNSYWTSLSIPPWVRRALPSNVADRLAGRVYNEIDQRLVRSRPFRQLLNLSTRWLNLDSLTGHETGYASVDAIYRDVDAAVAAFLKKSKSKAPDTVYCYEDGALRTFFAAKELGIKRVYHLPIPYWKTLHEIYHAEAEISPDWASTLVGLRDSAAKLERKAHEIDLASSLVAASSFTMNSIPKRILANKSVTVAPYGGPRRELGTRSIRRAGEPIKLLFAGHLSQRKGISYLIEACNSLSVPWTLTIAGVRMPQSPKQLDDFLLDDRCDWLGHVPRERLLRLMNSHHLLVFPSIAEGFGMVISEALASGLPVITTNHTAAPDLFENGCAGFIHPIREPELMAESIERLYNDESLRQQMAVDARRVSEKVSWDSYYKQVSDLLFRNDAQ